ncbi:hypothetical protein [Syntrophomonas erecta]
MEKKPVEWKRLLNVHDNDQSQVIESLLASENIPVLRKEQGTGNYLRIYMGSSLTGVDIYVPDSCYQQALELLTGDDEYLPSSASEAIDVYQPDFIKRKKTARMIIAITIIAPVIIGLIYIIVSNLLNLFHLL